MPTSFRDVRFSGVKHRAIASMRPLISETVWYEAMGNFWDESVGIEKSGKLRWLQAFLFLIMLKGMTINAPVYSYKAFCLY